MPHARSRPPVPQRLSLTASALAAIWMIGEWILLVAGTRPHEMLVGAGSLLLTALFLYYLHRVSTLRIELRARDLFTCWRIPGYIAADAWLIVKVLFRDLFSRHKAGSYYRVSGFATSKHDPRLVGRRVLATLYTTCSPNSIIIGIDYTQNRMLMHQLERTENTALARELGAAQ